jgi:hypothetical protein
MVASVTEQPLEALSSAIDPKTAPRSPGATPI